MTKDEQRNLLEATLQSLNQGHELVELYKGQENPSRFIAGYIYGVDGDHVLIAAISPAGTYDGYILVKKTEIFQISHQTRYLKRLEQLANAKRTVHDSAFMVEGVLLRGLLAMAKQKQCVLSMSAYDSGKDDVICTVEEMDDAFVKCHCYSEYGEKEGISILEIGGITQIACDTEDEQYIPMLIAQRETKAQQPPPKADVVIRPLEREGR